MELANRFLSATIPIFGVDCVVNKAQIGNDVMIGYDVLFVGQNHEFVRTDIPMRLQGSRDEPPIIIGNDVWIGHRAILLPSVRVGNGVIIGAGSSRDARRA